MKIILSFILLAALVCEVCSQKEARLDTLIQERIPDREKLLEQVKEEGEIRIIIENPKIKNIWLDRIDDFHLNDSW